MSTALCYAGPEFDGTALKTTDFGKTWRHVPDGGLSLNAASCADATTCVLGADQAVAVTKDAGHSWVLAVVVMAGVAADQAGGDECRIHLVRAAQRRRGLGGCELEGAFANGPRWPRSVLT